MIVLSFCRFRFFMIEYRMSFYRIVPFLGKYTTELCVFVCVLCACTFCLVPNNNNSNNKEEEEEEEKEQETNDRSK